MPHLKRYTLPVCLGYSPRSLEETKWSWVIQVQESKIGNCSFIGSFTLPMKSVASVCTPTEDNFLVGFIDLAILIKVMV